MKKPRIGFIGLGQIATSGHLPKYEELGQVELVAACDTDVEKLDQVCERYKIPNRYTDFRKLLERDDLDAVDVCLHNNLHAPVTIAALRSGKHVYCEKPIAGSYVDGKAMVDAARETGKMLHIQLGTLYSKEAKAAKKLISEGALGKIYHARSTGYRRRGRPFVDGYGTANFVKKQIAAGGALFDMGIYHIAQLLYLIGMPGVERISGKIYQELDMDEARRISSGYDVEELGLGFIRFENGLTMDIIEAWAVNMDPFEGSSIFGSKGGIRLNPFSYYTTFCDMEMNCTFELDSVNTRWHRLNPDESAYDSSVHHWVAALQGKVELLPTAEIALLTMLIQEGIYMSDALGREVSAEEVIKNSKSTAVDL